MKELSIEEKAKRYDIALDKIKMLLGTGSSCSREELEYVFPELAESDDEKVRKEIIDFVKSRGGFKGDWIAWLEKQGEHANFRNKIQIGDKVTRNKDGMLVNLSQLNRVAKKDEKQGEQKPNIDFSDLRIWKYIIATVLTEIGGAGQYLDSPITEEVAKKLQKRFGKIEQKPAWSEEDEHMFNTIANSLNREKVERVWNTTEEEVDNWLKSIKDRYTWKPNNEHYELEEFAKIVRGNLTGISKAVQKLFEAKYLQLTGNKMYRGFKD